MAAGLAMAAAGGTGRAAAGSALLVPRLAGDLRVDGNLDEACYRLNPPLTNFVVAGDPATPAPATKAWLFWQPDRLVFAFEATDTNLVAAPKSPREHDVDAQDRVEIFLWSGNPNDTYYCVEVGARGAIHDYSARFYRRFDDAWSPPQMKIAVATTPSGYRVEAELPRAAVESAGFKLRAHASFRCGLFRADFRLNAPDNPTWICWVDARGPKPDFHVAESFGTLTLIDEPAKP